MTVWYHLMYSECGLSEQAGGERPGGHLPPGREIHLPATFGPEGLEGVTASRRNIHNHRPRFPLVVVFAGEARMVSGQREECRDRGMTTNGYAILEQQWRVLLQVVAGEQHRAEGVGALYQQQTVGPAIIRSLLSASIKLNELRARTVKAGDPHGISSNTWIEGDGIKVLQQSRCLAVSWRRV